MNALASSPQTRKCYKSLHWAPPIVRLPCVYLMSPHITRSPRPSLVIFAYCKRSKTGDGTSLWNTATVVSDHTTLLQQFAATTHTFCWSHGGCTCSGSPLPRAHDDIIVCEKTMMSSCALAVTTWAPSSEYD